MKTALIVRAVLGALSLAVIFARPRWQFRWDAGDPSGPRVGDAISIEGRPFPSCRERRNETVTSNHGVEGSSPSALTKNNHCGNGLFNSRRRRTSCTQLPISNKAISRQRRLTGPAGSISVLQGSPPLTAPANTHTPVAMNIPPTRHPTEHRCEALTISEMPPYRCTTSATGARYGREVCPSHASALHVRWFDDDHPDVPHLHG
jgi:hypothetical protein